MYLTSKEGALFYSGDISVTPQRTVSGISFPRLRPDVLVLESTYGQRLHANHNVEEQRLVEIVAAVAENRGKILIPAFALGRAQEVILILRGAISRKQLKFETIPPLNKSGRPEGKGIQELWAYLADRPRKAGYTTEELLRIWSGRQDLEEKKLTLFRGLLQEERFFKPDSRRIFLYHPLPEEEVRAREAPKVMEVNEMLTLAERYFPAGSGLYKKDVRFGKKNRRAHLQLSGGGGPPLCR